ncbi:hypothetical protein MRB53_039242 [Persea americana]|nr:hypothetical protein MRB53_039242 [Persea americana]
MLYIKVLINGHPVTAFVDSGAQATVMSPACAERCDISRSVDKRFAGTAVGVGTAKILGRVHKATLTVGDYELPCAFTIMEGRQVDLLFGLDMLKRYQASIDLFKNELRFSNGASVKFLPESEHPKFLQPELPGVEVIKPADLPPTSAAGFTGLGGANAEASSSSSSAQVAAPPANKTTTAPTSAPARPPAPTPNQAAMHHSEDSIRQLVQLGATREQAIVALQASGGNVDYAAAMLMDY